MTAAEYSDLHELTSARSSIKRSLSYISSSLKANSSGDLGISRNPSVHNDQLVIKRKNLPFTSSTPLEQPSPADLVDYNQLSIDECKSILNVLKKDSNLRRHESLRIK